MTERVAVDIGGTFVDSVAFDYETGRLREEKAPTTPSEPSEGVLDAIQRLDLDIDNAGSFVHGTTLGLNSLLERDGARTGIITNEGFRDVLEMGRHSVPGDQMYDIKYQRPELLVPRRRRLGVSGRIDADGEVVEPLDEDAVVDAARELVEDNDTSSIAVCFLNAYRNAEHEKRAAELIREAFPDVALSISSDITREYREYERTSTTVLDAYIKPIFESYVDQLDGSLREKGFDGSFFITRSGGGALDAADATEAPVHTIFSGPAGGLIGSSAVGNETGRDDLIAVDMGGTSLDTCVIDDGTPAIQYDSELEEQSLLIPVYDLRTIGAGGGSIAWIDRGLLKVGPESAGADPGPICYDRGGERPTVTDAAAALGYIDGENFMSGDMTIDVEGARSGIGNSLADPLEMSIDEASRGVFDVMLANTVSAIREITVEKGLDPREFSMIGYGGAGPMVMPLVAREMGIQELLIPQAPGVFSAWGMLMADTVYDFSQTEISLLENTTLDTTETAFDGLESEASETLSKSDYDGAEQQFERSIEMRYHGQEHTVRVPFDDVESISDLKLAFAEKHKSRFGHAMDDPAEIVHFRVRAIGLNDKPTLQPRETAGGDPLIGSRDAYCFAADDRVDFDIYDREKIETGAVISGPAIILEPTTTVVFYSDQEATVDEYGHLVISGGEGE